MNKQYRMRSIKHIHFVGIGGSGMGGIAEVLLQQGYRVSGSDTQHNAMTQHLCDLGATVYQGQCATQVDNVDVVVVSTAVQGDNVEIVAAQQRRIPIVPRAQMLAELMRFRYGIAVAGTHGKTTVTSFIATVLTEAKVDPTFVIGGRLNSANSNARLGQSEYLVVEADESDASFLYLHPMIAVVTNIDADHMDTYEGDFNKLKNTFITFLHQLPFYGLAVLCADDPVVMDVLPDISRPVLTYGFAADADVRVVDWQQLGFQSQFNVLRKGNAGPLAITLNLPGRHNVQNALAAITVASELGLSDADIQHALLHFTGIGRRLQICGELAVHGGQVLLIDDYGHHPREISATLDAIAQAWPDKRLVMLYQPHRFTRTRDLFDDFSRVLGTVDVLLMLDVYSAGEKPITGADSMSLCRSIRQRGAVDPVLIKDEHELVEVLAKVLQAGDILLTQGAGNITTIASHLASGQLKFTYV